MNFSDKVVAIKKLIRIEVVVLLLVTVGLSISLAVSIQKQSELQSDLNQQLDNVFKLSREVKLLRSTTNSNLEGEDIESEPKSFKLSQLYCNQEQVTEISSLEWSELGYQVIMSDNDNRIYFKDCYTGLESFLENHLISHGLLPDDSYVQYSIRGVNYEDDNYDGDMFALTFSRGNESPFILGYFIPSESELVDIKIFENFIVTVFDMQFLDGNLIYSTGVISTGCGVEGVEDCVNRLNKAYGDAKKNKEFGIWSYDLKQKKLNLLYEATDIGDMWM